MKYVLAQRAKTRKDMIADAANTAACIIMLQALRQPLTINVSRMAIRSIVACIAA